MATSEERLRILKMIQDGKITPEEGIQLMEALETNSRRTAPRGAEPPAAARNSVSQSGQIEKSGRISQSAAPRWLRVRVTETNTGRVRVNVRLPVGVVSAGLKMGAKFSPEVEGMDMNQLMEFVRAGETGKVIDIYDDEDGEHVEVFIE